MPAGPCRPRPPRTRPTLPARACGDPAPSSAPGSRPAEAALPAGVTPPVATVDRADTLLIPDQLLRGAAAERIDAALAPVGLRIESPPTLRESFPTLDTYLEDLNTMPRAAVLRVRDDAPPTVIDAWVALQAVRAAAAPGTPLEPDIVARVGLGSCTATASSTKDT